jgi:hypothetical protein
MGCGYNLRALPGDRRCPECGKPVAESRAARPFQCADYRWQRSIRCGLFLTVAGLVAFELLPYLAPKNDPSIYYSREDLLRLWPLTLMPAAWWLRRGEATDDQRAWSARWLLRLLTIHLAVLLLIPVLRKGPWPHHLTATNNILLAFYAVDPVLVLISVWLILQAILEVSTRLPARPIRRETVWFRRLFCGVLAVGAAIEIAICIARMVRDDQDLYTDFYLPGIWGPLTSQVATVAYMILRPLRYYLPVHVLRFVTHLRALTDIH